jgi:hypothetical protein
MFKGARGFLGNKPRSPTRSLECSLPDGHKPHKLRGPARKPKPSAKRIKAAKKAAARVVTALTPIPTKWEQTGNTQ